MAERPYDRAQYNRALIANALLDPFTIVLTAVVLIAGILLGALPYLLPVAAVLYLGGAARTYFDEDAAQKVLERERGRRRRARGPASGSTPAARRPDRASAARGAGARAAHPRARSTARSCPTTRSRPRSTASCVAMDRTAGRAQLLYEALEDTPPYAVERRLEEVRGDPGRAELAEALTTQLATQRRMEAQLQRFYDELERMLVELDTVRSQLVSLSASTRVRPPGRAGRRGARAARADGRGGRGDVGRLRGRRLNDLEVAPAQAAERAQLVVVPARVRRAARRTSPSRCRPRSGRTAAARGPRRAPARGRPEMSTDALSRSRSPMRGSAGSSSEEAKWRAGNTNALPALGHGHAQRVRDAAAPDLLVAGEQRQDRQPGGVGARPAGRAQARPAQAPGRAGAGGPAPARRGAARTARRACSGCGRRAARGGRRRRPRRPRCGRRAGSGSARGRTRPRSRSAPRERAVRRPTTSYGIPIGPPSQRPEPKSAFSAPSTPIERTIAAESGATGSASTRWLVDQPDGNSGQPAIGGGGGGDRGEHAQVLAPAGSPCGAGAARPAARAPPRARRRAPARRARCRRGARRPA